MDPNYVPPPDIKLNKGQVGALKHELARFDHEGTCRMCQMVFGFGLMLFLVAVTLLLFAQKGVSPKVIIPVAQAVREEPLSRDEEAAIMNDLRAAAQAGKKQSVQMTHHHGEDSPAPHIDAP